MNPPATRTQSSTIASLVAQLAQLGSARYPAAAPRLLKATRLATTRGIAWQGQGDCYWVQSDTDASALYLVNLDGPACTCKDFERHQHACKHLLAVRLLRAASELDATYQRARDLDAPIPFTLTRRGLTATEPMEVA